MMDYETLLAAGRPGPGKDPNSLIGRIRDLAPGEFLNAMEFTTSTKPSTVRAGLSYRLRAAGLSTKEFTTRVIGNDLWVIRLKAEDIK